MKCQLVNKKKSWRIKFFASCLMTLFLFLFIFKYQSFAQTTTPNPPADPFAPFKQLNLLFNLFNFNLGSIPPPPTYTPITPSVVPTINPLLSTSVEQLVTNVRSNCQYNGIIGSVSQGNFSCLSSGPTQVNPTAAQYMIQCVDPAQFDFSYLQCVCFASAAVAMTTGQPLTTIPSAKDYITNPPAGYHFVSKSDPDVQGGSKSIRPGDLMLWSFPSKGINNYGHIAYTVEVIGTSQNGTQTFFITRVAEANWDLHGQVEIRPYYVNTDDPNIYGWLTPN